jgi:hypothetical protein
MLMLTLAESTCRSTLSTLPSQITDWPKNDSLSLSSIQLCLIYGAIAAMNNAQSLLQSRASTSPCEDESAGSAPEPISSEVCDCKECLFSFLSEHETRARLAVNAATRSGANCLVVAHPDDGAITEANIVFIVGSMRKSRSKVKIWRKPALRSVEAGLITEKVYFAVSSAKRRQTRL